MKKICLTVVAATAMMFSTQNMVAQEIGEEQVAVEQQETEYVAIDVAELPVEVTDALERDYAGAMISEAFVKDENGEVTYKLKVTSAEGEEMKLYADAEGNWVEEDELNK